MTQYPTIIKWIVEIKQVIKMCFERWSSMGKYSEHIVKWKNIENRIYNMIPIF